MSGGLKQLTGAEQKLVLDCMQAIYHGPMVDAEEADTMLGVTKEQLGKIIQCWPDIDDADPTSPGSLAINNCMVLIRALTKPDEWDQWVDGSREEVGRVFTKWRNLKGDPVVY